MPDKNELVHAVIKILHDLAEITVTDWEQAYLRSYSAGPGHSSREYIYRLGRTVAILDHDSEVHSDLLGELLPSLYDVVEVESGKRPFVAVFTVTKGGEYSMTLDYDSKNALEISLMALGRATSFFKANEVDIPKYVLDYQQELAKKGITETPVMVPAGVDVRVLFSDNK